MSGNPFTPAEAARFHDLTSLITSPDAEDGGTRSTVFPSEDTIAALLHARARAELPYTRVSASGTEYIVVNPLRALNCLNDESRRGYEDDIERTDGGIVDEEPKQPNVYELAGRAWLLMQRQREDQTIVFHGLTGSGKSTTSRHLTSQILKLSATTKAQRKVSDQITYLYTLLEAFGHSKTATNPSASQHGKYLELHFGPDGAISGAKVLAFGLNKSRVGRLSQDERTFHVFYQMLAGASPEEREGLGLDDPDMYALLASSGCYHLPAGPFSDDSTQLGELRAAMASLGFKAKHVRSIFSVLTAILTLSNLTFLDDRATGSLGMVSYEERTQVVERELLVEVSHHLGVNPEELETVLVNRTKWVSHDLASVFLNAEAAAEQRDSLMRDLYAILFAFVVELANRRLAPAAGAPATLQIAQLDVPGHQSRTLEVDPNARRSHFAPLIAASGQNGFTEFSANFTNELVHSYLVRRTFEDGGWAADMIADGIRVPSVPTMDNSACVELLRGGPLGSLKLAQRPLGIIGVMADVGEHYKGEDRELVKAQAITGALTTTFTGHPSFVPRVQSDTSRQGRMFGINHYSGQVAYDATDFMDRNADVLDKQLVTLLRGSSDPFIAKLVSGPALATESHPLDETIVVEAQVSVSPLRTPTPITHRVAGTPVQTEVSWPIDDSTPQPVGHQINGTLSTLFSTIDRTRVWTVLCLRPNDSGHANSYDRRRLKAQVQSLLIPDIANRRQIDYVAEYPLQQFCVRHALPADDPADSIDEFARTHGWMPGTDYATGSDRVWLSWNAWREQEDLIRSTETRRGSGEETLTDEDNNPYSSNRASAYGRFGGGSTDNFRQSESMDNLLTRGHTRDTAYDAYGYADTPSAGASEVWLAGTKEDYDHLTPAEGKAKAVSEAVDQGAFVTSEKRHHATEVIATTNARRWWIRITWLFTWWIPSFLLSSVGRMKRADVRMAWREKVTICMMIALLCGTVIFYIVGFGRILCPDFDKAWNTGELGTHQGEDDYYGAIYGRVYDFTKFYKGDHSDIDLMPTTTPVMMQFAGQDLTKYFPKPIYQACNRLTQDDNLALKPSNFTPVDPNAVHYSGKQQSISETKLKDANWWSDTLSPTLRDLYKGSLVFDRKDVAAAGEGDTPRQWAIYQKKVYDLSDYIYTTTTATGSGEGVPNYAFLNDDVTKLFQQSPGQDITKSLDAVLGELSTEDKDAHLECLDNAFYWGQLDFRKEAKCTVQNYLLLTFSILLMSTIGAKFLAALQLGSKRHPEILDKFVVCQVPCYTEGEESLKKTIDSLATLQYDDKRKLIFIICDGNIIGSGNNRPTPRIVLDILGVDPKLDPEPLLFKSIGEGSKKLNYGKIYSGLYEYEGHVVPYVVVVKVGKPTETSRPGNRGKRDSQVLLMQYLNRVHFDAPMCPLELEIYHQMRNVIGIDPTFYEYIFQVDADTTVAPDSLNRLIACTADDSAIIGICGETKVANEKESLTTMIQVYEYYISHHLTKAFESLFGSVTCLPGCFSVYRIRTADKGRPVIISSIVIDEYAEPNVDTLHKKNLFSLGEDRYLTTLMMKHFPTYKMKFTPDALAYTVAPSRWNVLLSQRRRWINSTIHNLVELLFLPEMCGFCLFSMRFIVFVDLLGTIILPATFVYLVYLIIVVSTQQSAIPYISIGMIAAVYGLQAILFILKREFMLIGWMVVYILAFPIYSLFLPLYSFWSMDDFSWGNTRKVIGEGNNKTVVYDDDQPFEESMIPYRTFKEYEANAWETTSLPSDKEDSESGYTTHTRRTSRTRRKRFNAGSMYSSTSHLPPPSRSGHSSRGPSPSPYTMPHLPSMGNMSTYGHSMYDQPYGGVPYNPFDSPAISTGPPVFPPYAPSPFGGMGQPRASTYSLATTANPFGVSSQGLQPNTDPSPTDATVLSVLKTYLNSQDLMTVTKRSARDAMGTLFPNAQLKDRAAWLNENIDKILSEA